MIQYHECGKPVREERVKLVDHKPAGDRRVYPRDVLVCPEHGIIAVSDGIHIEEVV